MSKSTRQKFDGVPAFPYQYVSGELHYGLSIRQYAAIQIAAGIATRDGYGNDKWPDNIAADAVQLADALLYALALEGD